MEELLSELRVLISTVDILDGHVEMDIKSELAHFPELIEKARKSLKVYQEGIENTSSLVSRQKTLIEQLNMEIERINYMKSKFPRELFRQKINSSASQNEVSLLSSITPQYHSFLSPIENTVFQSTSQFDISLPTIKSELRERTLTEIKQNNIVSKDRTPQSRQDLDVSLAYISNNEFDAIPQYMRGRLRVSDLNKFIDLCNTVLNKKYNLLKRSKASIKLKKDLDQWIEWKSQIGKNRDITDQYFWTLKDFSSQGGVKLGKREFSMLTILRHVKRIKEIREKQTTFYVACF